jgi:hypothetical protein
VANGSPIGWIVLHALPQEHLDLLAARASFGLGNSVQHAHQLGRQPQGHGDRLGGDCGAPRPEKLSHAATS